MFRYSRKFCERPMRAFSNVRVLLFEGSARQVMPMTEALHRLGCFVTTVNSSVLDLGYASRYPNKKILAHWRYGEEAVLLETILKELQKEQYDLVVPLTDFSARVLAKNKTEIAKYARPVVNDWDVFQKASDKLQTMRACYDANVPCPETYFNVKSLKDVVNLDIRRPFIIKPRVGYGSIGFHCIRDEKDLTENYRDYAFDEYVVQDYVPQTGKQYKCEVYIDRNGEVKSAVVFDKTRWFPIDGGSTCCSTTVERPDVVENSVRLLQEIGWRGYGDVDLIEDPRDGLVKVMEINPRITASVKICFKAGVNFARQIVEDELGRTTTAYPDYKKGVCLRYMHTDLLWFLSSPERFRTKPSWFSWKKTVDQIWSFKDPLPFFAYSIEAVMKYRKEMKKRKR